MDIQITISEELTRTPFACALLTQLSGGTANFVYQGILATPLPDGTKTVIVKHAEEYLASNREFRLSAERCRFEEHALRALEGMQSITTTNLGKGDERYQTTVKTPKLYHFSPSTNTQIMEDLPDAVDLKTFIRSQASDTPQDISQDWATSLGKILGIWLSSFHMWVNDTAQKDTARRFGQNKTLRDLKFSINYEGLVSMIDVYPEILKGARGVFESVRDMAAKEVVESERFLLEGGKGSEGRMIGAIHGDFWSGNVLIPTTTLSEPTPVTPLLITDWELSSIGHLALDLGQMIAELYQLKHYKDLDAGVWLIQGFAEGYGGISEELAFRILIHVGVHFVTFGSTVPGWGDEEQVRGLVELGRDLVVQASRKERGWFVDTRVWGCLFS